MAYQSKLSKKVSNYQRVIQNKVLEQIGQSVNLLKVSYSEDRYGDREFSLDEEPTGITAFIDFPGNEVPISYG